MKKQSAIKVLRSASHAIRQNIDGKTPIADAMDKAVRSLEKTDGYDPNEALPPKNVDVLVKLDDDSFDIDHRDRHGEWTWGEDAGIIHWWYLPGNGGNVINA